MSLVGDRDLPQDYDSLRALILERHGQLPKRLAQVARFAIENPEDIAFGTAASIAEAADVQPSTLVRLAQSLGFQGFSDLQTIFRDRLKARNWSYEERIAQANSALRGQASGALGIASGMFGAAMESVERVLHDLDPAALEKATDILARADTIYLLAQKRSYPAASYLAYTFGKLKMKTVLVGAGQGGEEDMLALAQPGDAALAISFSPYAPTTIDWTRLLVERGLPVVGLTDSVFSPLSGLSTVWLEITESDYEGFRSLSATMAISASLAVAAAAKRKDLEPG